VEAKLATLPAGTVIVHGGARGADRLAAEIASTLGLEVEEHPANWYGHGKSAGYRRNIEMLDSGVEKVIAFWRDGSAGTGHTVKEAHKRGIKVEIVHVDDYEPRLFYTN
jgi:hypothetical protein